MERAAGLSFHKHKISLDNGKEVIPKTFLHKAVRSLTLSIPQSAINAACDIAVEKCALTKSEYISLCLRHENTALDLGKLRSDLEHIANQNYSGMMNRDALKSVLTSSGTALVEESSFDAFFDGFADGSEDGSVGVEDFVSQMDPLLLVRQLDALDIDECSSRNYTALRSEPVDRKVIADAFEGEKLLAQIMEEETIRKQKEQQLKEAQVLQERERAETKKGSAAASGGAPEKKAAPVMDAPKKQEKAKSGCC